jgi:hypothetical protein
LRSAWLGSDGMSFPLRKALDVRLSLAGRDWVCLPYYAPMKVFVLLVVQQGPTFGSLAR